MPKGSPSNPPTSAESVGKSGVSPIKDGDIFGWRYRSEKLHSDYLNYWAKSQIAVARDGVLRDTYWSGNSDGAVWSYAEAGGRLVLTHVANFADLEPISEGEGEYYAEGDIVNLNHGNSPKGNCYRRKGTDRNREVMLARVDRASERARSEMRSAQRDIERLTETRAALHGGAELKGIWI